MRNAEARHQVSEQAFIFEKPVDLTGQAIHRTNEKLHALKEAHVSGIISRAELKKQRKALRSILRTHTRHFKPH